MRQVTDVACLRRYLGARASPSLCRAVVSAVLIAALGGSANAQPAWVATTLSGFPIGLFPTCCGSTAAYAINDYGQVVGWGESGRYSFHQASLWAAGRLTAIPAANASHAHSISDAGHVVCVAGPLGGSLSRAFVWTAAGGTVYLDGLGGESSVAHDVNVLGQVVGATATASGATHAFVWTPKDGTADLGTLGGVTGYAYGINDLGHIVGGSSTGHAFHAFLWTMARGMIDIGTLGGAASWAHDINLAGQAVGRSNTASGDVHAFLWTASGGMVDLGTLGGTWSEAYGINRRGWVVGASTTAGGATHAFVWTPASGMVDLGVSGGTSSVASGVNDAGQVVGWVSGPGRQSATVWSGPWRDLAIDFGAPYGVLTAHDGARWRLVHGGSPSAMVVGDLDGSGVSDLVVNFGPGVGVFAWMNASGWRLMHPLSPSQMTTGDLNHDGRDDVIFVFPGEGVWRWALDVVITYPPPLPPGLGESWTLLHGLEATHLAVGNLDATPGAELIAE